MYDISAPEGLRPLVRGLYQLQKLRIQTGNRLVNHYLKKMGVEPGEETPSEVKEILSRVKKDYKRLTDSLAEGTVETYCSEEGLISSAAELAFVEQYFTQLREERREVRKLSELLAEHPLWKLWLKHVKGVGPMMTGVLLSELKLERARYPSSFWKYCGLDVAPDGKGRSRRKGHLVEREYIDKDGKPAKRKGLSFNPFLKTKVMGVLTQSMLYVNSQYRVVYDNYRARLDNHPVYRDRPKAHKMWMSRRYMAKIFLRDLFIVMCRLSGRKEPKPYEEAKLGMKPEHPVPLVPIEGMEEENHGS